jgi:hypothetical protein
MHRTFFTAYISLQAGNGLISPFESAPALLTGQVARCASRRPAFAISPGPSARPSLRASRSRSSTKACRIFPALIPVLNLEVIEGAN